MGVREGRFRAVPGVVSLAVKQQRSKKKLKKKK